MDNGCYDYVSPHPSFIKLCTFHKRSALPLQNQQVKTIYYNCLKELKISHPVSVYSTAFLKSPVLIGIIHPRIYIPIHLISELNPDDMRFMLLHELQHYRHKDTFIGFLMVISNILYWFNPFVWYTLKEILCDREIACDSAVLQMISADEYQAYGTTLINFAEKISSFLSTGSWNVRKFQADETTYSQHRRF